LLNEGARIMVLPPVAPSPVHALKSNLETNETSEKPKNSKPPNKKCAHLTQYYCFLAGCNLLTLKVFQKFEFHFK